MAFQNVLVRRNGIGLRMDSTSTEPAVVPSVAVNMTIDQVHSMLFLVLRFELTKLSISSP